jgi:hypothetical protein
MSIFRLKTNSYFTEKPSKFLKLVIYPAQEVAIAGSLKKKKIKKKYN